MKNTSRDFWIFVFSIAAIASGFAHGEPIIFVLGCAGFVYEAGYMIKIESVTRG